MEQYGLEQYTDEGAFPDFVESLEALAEKYNVSEKVVLRAIATEVSSFEELKQMDYRDLDAAVQEGLAILGR